MSIVATSYGWMPEEVRRVQPVERAPRPHLYTADTRLGDAIEAARLAYPHEADRFRAHVARYGCVTYDTAEVHWILWRNEYCRAEDHR